MASSGCLRRRRAQLRRLDRALPQSARVNRIFGLEGGHIQPTEILRRLGIRIIDVRHEGAAVNMAHAHAEPTGETAVAMVTAGPGVTNTRHLGGVGGDSVSIARLRALPRRRSLGNVS